jgi:hypothetical protein
MREDLSVKTLLDRDSFKTQRVLKELPRKLQFDAAVETQPQAIANPISKVTDF